MVKLAIVLLTCDNFAHTHKQSCLTSIYEKKDDEYHFTIKQELPMPPPTGTDINAFVHGKISHSIIDLRQLRSYP
jgi:hypothetical protein